MLKKEKMEENLRKKNLKKKKIAEKKWKCKEKMAINEEEKGGKNSKKRIKIINEKSPIS